MARPIRIEYEGGFYHVTSRENARQEIFEGTERNEGIYNAVYLWGYKLKDVGNYIGLHYSRVSKIAARMAKSKT